MYTDKLLNDLKIGYKEVNDYEDYWIKNAKNLINDKNEKIISIYFNYNSIIKELDFKTILKKLSNLENEKIQEFITYEKIDLNYYETFVGYFLNKKNYSLNDLIIQKRNKGDKFKFNEIKLIFEYLLEIGILFQDKMEYHPYLNTKNINIINKYDNKNNYQITNPYTYSRYTQDVLLNLMPDYENKLINNNYHNDFKLRKNIIEQYQNSELINRNNYHLDKINLNIYDISIIMICIYKLVDFDSIYDYNSNKYKYNVINKIIEQLKSEPNLNPLKKLIIQIVTNENDKSIDFYQLSQTYQKFSQNNINKANSDINIKEINNLISDNSREINIITHTSNYDSNDIWNKNNINKLSNRDPKLNYDKENTVVSNEEKLEEKNKKLKNIIKLLLKENVHLKKKLKKINKEERKSPKSKKYLDLRENFINILNN